MVSSWVKNFQVGIVGTVKDDKEEEDSSDVPHRDLRGSTDSTDSRLKG